MPRTVQSLYCARAIDIILYVSSTGIKTKKLKKTFKKDDLTWFKVGGCNPGRVIVAFSLHFR